MDNNGIPTIELLRRYKVDNPDKKEVVRQTLYDFTSYAAAGQTQLSFFQTPKGQSGKTIADTNMSIAGMLPKPQQFLVESIEIYFFPGVLPVTYSAAAMAASEFMNDVYTFGKSGSFNFFTQSKTYLEEAPLGRFPPKTRLEGDFAAAMQRHQAAAADATDLVQMDYAAMIGRPYRVEPKILLEEGTNFSATMNWPSVVALPSGQAARVGVVLDGLLIRNSQ